MKLWIPGASGMLGKHLTSLIKEPFIGNDVGEVDITNLDAVKRFVGEEAITHIINCAAYTLVDKAESDEALAFAVNVTGPKNLGIVSHTYQIPLIHISTDYIFDGASNKPYSEEDPANPLGNYGLTKWQGEQAIMEQTELHCIIRTSWLFGLYGNNFVLTMLKLMQERETLNIVSDQIGRPTYAHDLADACLKMIDQKGVYHFANANETTWYDFAKEIHKVALSLGYPLKTQKILPIKTSQYPTPAKRPLYSTLNTEKIEKFLKPRPWKEALVSHLRSYRECYEPICQ